MWDARAQLPSAPTARMHPMMLEQGSEKRSQKSLRGLCVAPAFRKKKKLDFRLHGSATSNQLRKARLEAAANALEEKPETQQMKGRTNDVSELHCTRFPALLCTLPSLRGPCRRCLLFRNGQRPPLYFTLHTIGVVVVLLYCCTAVGTTKKRHGIEYIWGVLPGRYTRHGITRPVV